MIRVLFISSVLILGGAAFAQDHGHEEDHKHHKDHKHETDDHSAHDNQSDADDLSLTPITLTRTPEIEAALEAGGEPIVVEVLGVVCDFCAKAMNKTFGKRADVSAVYVDLDAKTLNLVLTAGATLADEEIVRLVVRAGYKAKAVRRGQALLGGTDAPDPA